jgi:type IV pilus assembly protein PilC
MAKISMSQAAKLFRRLAVGYKAGLDLRNLLNKEAGRGDDAMRYHLGKVSKEISQGTSLAEAMKRTDGFFNNLQCTIVDVGERSGRLEQAFANLADHYDQNISFRRNFLVAIAWPMFELFAAIIIIGLLILVMGWVASFSKSKPIDWFGLGWSTTQYFAAYVSCVVFAVVSVTLFGMGLAKGWFGLLPLKIAMRIPGIGGLLERLALSRFAWAIEVTFDAGINAVDAMKMSLTATQNWFYTRLQKPIVDNLASGNSLYYSLHSTGAFNEEFLVILENGEITGQIPETMAKITQQYRDEILARLRTLAILMFFVVMGIVALAIIFCIFMIAQKMLLDPINNELQNL